MTSASIIIPTSIDLPPFDPRNIYAEHLANRKVVYLDNNFWIKLTDGKTPAARSCRQLCIEAVARSVAVFPISYASISELLEQPPQAPRDAQAALMDELSTGITFRSEQAIHEYEIRSGLEFLLHGSAVPHDRSELFTFVIEYMSGVVVDVPAGFTVDEALDLADHYRMHPDLRSVSWLLAHMDLCNLQSVHAASASTYVEKMGEHIKRVETHFRDQGKFNKHTLLLEERAGLLHATVFPAIARLVLKQYPLNRALSITPQLAQGLKGKDGNLDANTLEALFSTMPSLEMFAELMAARMLNPGRKVKRQDFWDIEHGRVAAPYSDVFATYDGELLDLLGSRCQLPRGRGCHFIRRLEDLETWLQCAITESTGTIGDG